MADRYAPQTIERKWQARWDAEGLYRCDLNASAPKHYALVMFPYTSGDLHIGHWYNFAPADAHARFKRMRGHNVFLPIGFDAFGLPAEEAAIKRGIHPFVWTRDNIERMTAQLKTIGGMYDWSHSLATCYPDYYRWNQWLFLQFYKQGLAYRAKAPANWCPHCQTVLANEQVLEGACERCGTPVIRRDLEQWFFRITNYAEELLDFSELEWPERVVAMQRNWIGRSTGVEFRLGVAEQPGTEIAVFTTRIDTVFGMTYVVLAPEHPLVDQLTVPEQRAAVAAYQEQARRQSEIERLSLEKDKTGVPLGTHAINPFNGERVPIWIADYVLTTYGTGAIMAVPGHDERDFAFAQKFGLPIREVIRPADRADDGALVEPYTGPGAMVNSGPFNGLPSEEGKERLAEWLEERGLGRRTVNYRLRDWLISRQRYWGTPIPIIYCPTCGTMPVPEADLPVLLPEDAEFRPTGESPLKLSPSFVNVACPRCGGPAQRETDTMDTFVDSSWYFLRYLDPHDAARPFPQELADRWCPVDQYMGGVEHAVMHLLYARFFTRVLRDLGLVSFSEPFKRLYNQGIILGEDNEKMSKSRGNVVNPDDYVAQFGADTVRVFLMFLGPWYGGGPWNTQGIQGPWRFLNNVWDLAAETAEGPHPSPLPGGEGEGRPHPGPLPGGAGESGADAELRRLMHKTTKIATERYEAFQYNTTISELMSYRNELQKLRGKVAPALWREAIERLLLLLAPAAPHLTEELWHRLGHEQSIHLQAWPTWDEALTVETEVPLVVQVNGKVRDQFAVRPGLSEDEARPLVLERPKIREQVNGRQIVKWIYVPNRLVNLVVK
ncbi:MAG TPA: leucine--tRNA ligase [Chloroflexota bacterium]|nr:leucine--tRNA ligase [Chloroflexota bacterium]